MVASLLRMTDEQRTSVDPRVRALATEIDKLREKRGMSRGALARASGVHATQMSHFLNGNVGVSVERMMDILRAVGAAMLVAPSDEARPLLLGIVDKSGRLMTDLDALVLPGMVEIEGELGPFHPGDQVHLGEASGFSAGRWVLIARDDGSHDLVLCEERAQARVLVTALGDAVLYEPRRHHIVASVHGRFERM